MQDKTMNRPRVFIDKVHLKGFKSIEDVSVNFKNGLNILIGKNGSGKSNFLEFVHQIMSYHPGGAIHYDNAVVNFISSDNHFFEFELKRPVRTFSAKRDDLDEQENFIERFLVDDIIVYNSSEDKGLRKNFNFNGKKIIYVNGPVSSFRRMGYESIFFPVFLGFSLPDKLDFINSSVTFTFEFEDYMEASYGRSLMFLNSILQEIELDISDKLFEDEENDEEIQVEKVKKIAFDSIAKLLIPPNIIVDNIKTYSPIEDLRFNKNVNIYTDSKRLIIENIKLEFKINGNWMPWSLLSDGTKRLFYIISEVTFSTGLVLIEEPELGIHPHQFNLLMDFLKEQSEHKQILISTHSPKALDHLSYEELDSILIANYDLKKGTQIRHLTTKEITKAKKYMKEVGFFSDYWMLSDLEE